MSSSDSPHSPHSTAAADAGTAPASLAQVHHRYAQVGDVKVFYREAGERGRPAVLLLHGFAASSFMYRNLIPKLAERYHVVAPDLPGFGFTESPPRGGYAYTFDQLTATIDEFTRQLGLERYAMQVFDYGAPVGWRLAASHPERVTAIVSQNGNAYEEGLGPGWAPIQKYWADPSPANREALAGFPTAASVKQQYTDGVGDPSLLAPEAYLLEGFFVSRPGNADVQLDLLLDYASNVARYPEFQAYFRRHRPPLLAVWGRNDPFFLPAGASAWTRDIPDAEIHFYDTGHLALETHGEEIGAAIRVSWTGWSSDSGAAAMRVGDFSNRQGSTSMDAFVSHHPYAAGLVRIGKLAIEQADDDALAAYFSPEDYVIHRSGGDADFVQLKSYFAALRAAFDDLRVEREQVFGEGRRLAARTVFSGIFARTFTHSPVGELPPNGRPVRRVVQNLFLFNEAGRLVEEWVESDSRALLQQLTAT